MTSLAKMANLPGMHEAHFRLQHYIINWAWWHKPVISATGDRGGATEVPGHLQLHSEFEASRGYMRSRKPCLHLSSSCSSLSLRQQFCLHPSTKLPLPAQSPCRSCQWSIPSPHLSQPMAFHVISHILLHYVCFAFHLQNRVPA